ncbi:MAG: lysozyme [Scytolyngbya sp. HA4215-MV1]|jgi:lysozyme|nr:lysozyme [Scytolyngbya sp. HA4215-MV1]
MVQTLTRPVLRITQYTVLKRHPAKLEDLTFTDKVAISPLEVPLKSYATTIAGQDLLGHIKVEFEESCHGSTVWYIDSAHGYVAQATVTPSPKPDGEHTGGGQTGNGQAGNPTKPASPTNNQMNEAGRNLLKEFEGLRLDAYLCPAGVWTIGYGSTFGVHPGDHITPGEAESRLIKDLDQFEKGVAKLVKVPLTSNQFSALVSFAYNLGLGALEESTLLRVLNKGDYQAAANELLRWDKANGVPLAGLTRRRKAEKELFLKP